MSDERCPNCDVPGNKGQHWYGSSSGGQHLYTCQKVDPVERRAIEMHDEAQAITTPLDGTPPTRWKDQPEDVRDVWRQWARNERRGVTIAEQAPGFAHDAVARYFGLREPLGSGEVTGDTDEPVETLELLDDYQTRVRVSIVFDVVVNHHTDQDSADVCAHVEGAMRAAWDAEQDPLRCLGEPDDLVRIEVGALPETLPLECPGSGLPEPDAAVELASLSTSRAKDGACPVCHVLVTYEARVDDARLFIPSHARPMESGKTYTSTHTIS